MKRLSFFVGALLLSLAVTGCGRSIDAPVNNALENTMATVDESSLTLSERCVLNAEKAIDSFHSKDWDALTGLFADNLKGAVTNDMWRGGYDQVMPSAGKYVKKTAYAVVYRNHAPVMEYLVQYENVVITYGFSFDNQAKLTSFTMPNVLKASDWTTCHADCIYDSERYIEAFRNKDWNYMRSKSSDLLASLLTDEFLEKAYANVMTDLGGYHSLDKRYTEKQGDKRIVHHINKHRNGQFDARITFLSDGKIDKFSFNPANVQKTEAGEDVPDPYAPAVNDILSEEKVKVAADEKYPLDGLLTLPKNVEKPPVVILLSGSGPNDMNETLMSNTPFKDIAHGLAAKGVAVLRFNKRTLTYGAVMSNAEATVDSEYMDDAAAAIKLLSADARVGRIFVLGHSLGGSLIPAISNAHPELAGVISAAGTLRSLDVVATEQINDAIEQARETLTEDQVKTVEAQVQPQLDELRKVSEITDKTPDDVMLFNVPVRYWKDLKKYISQELVSQMKHPFLIAQGEADYQVKPDVDYKIWLEIACNRENVTCKLYPKLNHLFMPTQGFKNGQDYAMPSHVSDEFIADVAAFILAN